MNNAVAAASDSLTQSSMSVAQGSSPRSRSRSNMTANLGTKKTIRTVTTIVPADAQEQRIDHRADRAALQVFLLFGERRRRARGRLRGSRLRRRRGPC